MFNKDEIVRETENDVLKLPDLEIPVKIHFARFKH